MDVKGVRQLNSRVSHILRKVHDLCQQCVVLYPFHLSTENIIKILALKEGNVSKWSKNYEKSSWRCSFGIQERCGDAKHYEEYLNNKLPV